MSPGVRCFFFQAEDGIRDIGVTGVQTCALPICVYRPEPAIDTVGSQQPLGNRVTLELLDGRVELERSEERRVGKECRSGGASPPEEKRKTKRSQTANRRRSCSELIYFGRLCL